VPNTRRAVGARALTAGSQPQRAGPWVRAHQFACGRPFRALNIVHDVTRECLAAISDHNIEFAMNAILAWSQDHIVEWHYIEKGKPM
jgi:putative transposase